MGCLTAAVGTELPVGSADDRPAALRAQLFLSFHKAPLDLQTETTQLSLTFAEPVDHPGLDRDPVCGQVTVEIQQIGRGHDSRDKSVLRYAKICHVTTLTVMETNNNSNRYAARWPLSPPPPPGRPQG